MSGDARVRRWRRTGICVLAQEAGESYPAHGEARNPVMAGGKRSHAKADRAWAGLRTRLRFGQAPGRDRRRTDDEKRSAADWLSAKDAVGDRSKKEDSIRSARSAEGPAQLFRVTRGTWH